MSLPVLECPGFHGNLLRPTNAVRMVDLIIEKNDKIKYYCIAGNIGGVIKVGS